MEDIFPKGLDLNAGQEPFGIGGEETPMRILDLEGPGIPNSGSGVNLYQGDYPLNPSLPEVERGKSLGGMEGSHDLEAVKPSDWLSDPLGETSRVLEHKPKGMLCTDLNEVMAEPPENPMPFVETGVTVLSEGSVMADGLTYRTDDLLEGGQPGEPLQTTAGNQFGAALGEGVSEAIDQRASCCAVVEVEEIGLGSTEPESASLAVATYSVDGQGSGEGLGSATEIENRPLDGAHQQQSLEMKLTDLAVENHRCCAVGNSGPHLESTTELQDESNSMGGPSDLQGRVSSMGVPSNPQGDANPMEDPSGLVEKGDSMEGTFDLQGRAESTEDPSDLTENARAMKGPFDLQGRVDSVEGSSCLQKSMERHTEGLVSAQDATNFEGQELSMAPSGAEQPKGPSWMQRSMERHTEGLGSAQDATNFEGQESSVTTPSTEQPKGPSCLQKSVERHTEGLVSAQDATNFEGQESSVTPSDAGQPKGPSHLHKSIERHTEGLVSAQDAPNFEGQKSLMIPPDSEQPKGPSCLQKSMERHIEGFVSAQDATNFEGQESSVTPPDAGQPKGPSCLQKSMERHTDGFVSAQDATNFEGQESSVMPPDAGQPKGPSCLHKSIERHTEGLVSDQDATNIEGQKSLTTPSDSEQPTGPSLQKSMERHAEGFVSAQDATSFEPQESSMIPPDAQQPEGPCCLHNSMERDTEGLLSAQAATKFEGQMSLMTPPDAQQPKGPSSLQKSMERHAEGFVSVQDATNFEGEESSMIPPNAELKGPYCLHKSMERHTEGLVSAQDETNFEGQESMTPPDAEQPKGPSFLHKSIERHTEGLVAAQDATNMEGQKSLMTPSDLEQPKGPSSLQKSMERHAEGLVSAQDATNFEGQESSMRPPDGEQPKGPSCLHKSMERDTEGLHSAQDASNFEGQKSSMAPPDAEQPNEHQLSVGDLVWVKVKYHPWWPGQVFDPLDASELARKNCKKDRLLVACFGDQTFAWCEESKLRPFRQNFAEMSKQSTAKGFYNAVNNALDELARRVRYGLACSCLPQKTHTTLDSKPIINAGIHEGVVVNDNRDISTAVAEFEPKKLLAYIQNLAVSPFTSDALEIAVACAQVSAFCALEMVLVRGKVSAETPLKHETASGAFGPIEAGIKHTKSSVRSSSGKRRQSSDGKQSLKNKKRRIGCLIAGGEITDNGGNDMTKRGEALLEFSGSDVKFFQRMTGTPKKLKMEEGERLSARKHSLSGSKKHKVPESYFSLGGYKKNSKDKQGKMYMNFGPPKAGEGDAMKTPKASRLGECISRIASQLTGSPPIIRCTNYPVFKNSPQHGGKKAILKHKRKNVTSPSNKLKYNWVVREDCPIKQLLLEFSLLAQNPTYCPEEETVLSRVTSVFLEFRDAVFQKGHGYWSYRKSTSLKPGKQAHKQKSPKGYSDLTGSLSMDDLKDINWTDKNVASSRNHRQVQRTSKRKAEVKVEDATKKKKQRMKAASPALSNEALKHKLEDETIEHDVNHSSRTSVVPVTPVAKEMDSPDGSNANQSPTALFMRFPPGFDVPSETELKEKFSPFGPLEMSETKVFSNSGCAQIVFKRCSDAEAAFHGATAKKVFGSAIVSFRLRYLSSRMKTDTPQTAKIRNDGGSRLHREGHSSILENTTRNVKRLKENAAQPSASEVPLAEGYDTSRVNPSEVTPLVFHQQNLETAMPAASPSVEQTLPSTTSKVDNVASGSKSNIVDAMMGLLQKVSTLVGSPN